MTLKQEKLKKYNDRQLVINNLVSLVIHNLEINE